MKLTQFTDFGLRVLMYLSCEQNAEPVKIVEIATQFDIPRNHLIKVVNKLAKLDWVETTRGRNGGLRLKVQPENLSVGLVLRELENCQHLIDCESRNCVLQSGCLLKEALDKGMQRFFEEMDGIMIADVIATPTGNKIEQMQQSYYQLSL